MKRDTQSWVCLYRNSNKKNKNRNISNPIFNSRQAMVNGNMPVNCPMSPCNEWSQKWTLHICNKKLPQSIDCGYPCIPHKRMAQPLKSNKALLCHLKPGCKKTLMKPGDFLGPEFHAPAQHAHSPSWNKALKQYCIWDGDRVMWHRAMVNTW